MLGRPWLALVAVLAVHAASASVSAQHAPLELGRLDVALPPPLRTSDLVVLSRRSPPHPLPSELPADAVELLGQWASLASTLRSAILERRGASSDAERAALDQRIGRLEGRATRARADLEASLAEHEDTLAPPARLLLGELRWESAADAHVSSLEAWDACVAAGSACADPPAIDDERAVATWAGLEGRDATAAWAWYERGVSASEHGDARTARGAFERVMSSRAAPPELAGEAAFRLAEVLDGMERSARADSLERCTRMAAPELAPHCALRAAIARWQLGHPPEALALLLPVLEAPDLPDAALFAGELVARGTELPPSIPDATRVRLLVLAAERLDAYGLRSRARASIASARAIADDPALAALQARYAPPAAPDTLELWLRRSIAFCAAADLDRSILRVEVRGQLGPRGARLQAFGSVPAAAAELLRCAAGIAPETPIVAPPFRAQIAL